MARDCNCSQSFIIQSNAQCFINITQPSIYGGLRMTHSEVSVKYMVWQWVTAQSFSINKEIRHHQPINKFPQQRYPYRFSRVSPSFHNHVVSPSQRQRLRPSRRRTDGGMRLTARGIYCAYDYGHLRCDLEHWFITSSCSSSNCQIIPTKWERNERMNILTWSVQPQIAPACRAPESCWWAQAQLGSLFHSKKEHRAESPASPAGTCPATVIRFLDFSSSESYCKTC